MKPNRDARELAARLSSAAAQPVPLPIPSVEAQSASPPQSAAHSPAPLPVKPLIDTIAMTLRPSRSLLQRYTMAAAERTQKEGRVCSAQQIMIEVLERGL